MFVQHTGDVVSGERRCFAPAGQREFSEESIRGAARDFGESIAVEKQERGTAMTAAKEVEEFLESYFAGAELFPLLSDSCMSF